MKNLIQVGERRRSLNFTSDGDDSIIDICGVVTDEIENATSTAVLTAKGRLVRLNDDGEIVWEYNLEELQPGGGWFNLAYIDPEIVCISRNGAMVTVNPTTADAELIGVFDFGLEAASWSPDGEILLMVTSTADEEDETKTNSVLMTMNSQFEVLAEIAIPGYVASSEKANSGISVAWRPDGTLCAVSAVDASDSVRKVRLYKRENLDAHAIGRSEDASGTIVKNLQDSGLAWAGPGCSQLLAAVQRKGKKTQQVVFFESNGLRHREFALREAPTTNVTSLKWNVNGDLLAVSLREAGNVDKVQLWHRCNYHWYLKQEFRYAGRKVQNVKFNEEKASEFAVLLNGFEWREYEVRWDPSTCFGNSQGCPAFVVDGCSLNITPLERALIPPPMSMKSITTDLPISEISFCPGTIHAGSIVLRLSDDSLVFLLRGESSIAYGYQKVSSEGAALSGLRSIVATNEKEGEIELIGVLSAGANEDTEQLVEMSITGTHGNAPSLETRGTSPLESSLLRAVNWVDTPSGCLLELQDGALLEYESENGSTRVIPSEAEPLLEPCPWLSAIKEAPVYEGPHDDAHSRMVFGLSKRSRLYFHDYMLSDSASSFHLSMSHEFLCYATTGSRCFLRFLPLKDVNSFDPLMGMDQNQLLEGYEPRSVERGARIVSIMPSQPMAVLQMPRGNLEGIYPRALILRFIMLQIAKGQYGEAFRMMRKHKVDLNVLVDFDPWYFYKDGINALIKQVPVIDHLNLFISGLQNWDVTQGRFPVPSWLRRENKESEDRKTFDFTTKVNQVCSKAREIMLAAEEHEVPTGHYLLPILSTFAKETPPKLDQALSLIKTRALKQHIENSKKPPMFSEGAQSAIHYLAFLAEYDLLFETALGMYDFEIARAVARNSQMDPKVYLPLLRRLNSLPESFAKYEVDLRLKRFDAALENLYKSYKKSESLEGFDPVEGSTNPFGNSFSECMELVKKNNLHGLGLSLFQDQKEESRTIAVALGENLLEQLRPKIALSVFLSANPPHHDGAKQAARAAGEWKTYFSLLMGERTVTSETTEEQKEIEAEKSRQVARDIAKEIVSKETQFATKSKQSLHQDAARILLDYGDDLLGAIDLLISSQCWSEAHRISSAYDRDDLVKRCTDGATEYAHGIIDEFYEKSTMFASTTEQYSTILKLRKKNVYEEGPATNEADDTASLFSAASTMSNMSLQSNASTGSTGSSTSVSSVISVKSSSTFTMTGGDEGHRHRSKFNKGKKQKKKNKKNKKRRKPGSEEELNALVFELKSSCPNAEYAEMISETVLFLIMTQQTSLAREVFDSYNRMRDAIMKCQTERIVAAKEEILNAERRSREVGEASEDDHHILVEIKIEEEVDALRCTDLQQSLDDFFIYLPK